MELSGGLYAYTMACFLVVTVSKNKYNYFSNKIIVIVTNIAAWFVCTGQARFHS